MFLLYTLLAILCFHFIMYYMNMDFFQVTRKCCSTHDPPFKRDPFANIVVDSDVEVETNINELSESLLLLKDKNKTYTQ
jgi:hypothetical protein